MSLSDTFISYADSKYPDISHPLAVASFFGQLTDEWVVGLFHDILEDKHVTPIELSMFLSQYERHHAYMEIVEITRKPSETYFDYIRRLKSRDNVSRLVKLADLHHNLSRKETLTPSLESRYRKAVKILADN